MQFMLTIELGNEADKMPAWKLAALLRNAADYISGYFGALGYVQPSSGALLEDIRPCGTWEVR